MLTVLRPLHPSKIWRVMCGICTLLVCSYIFFDVLDLDGSDFLRFFHPVQKTIIVATVSAEADLYNSHEMLAQRGDTLISITPQSESFTSSPKRTLSILSSLHSTWAHGYRVGLARNSLPD